MKIKRVILQLPSIYYEILIIYFINIINYRIKVQLENLFLKQ
jgi:hypothetical protein